MKDKGLSELLESRRDNPGIAIQTPLQFVRGMPVTAGWETHARIFGIYSIHKIESRTIYYLT